MDEFEIQNVTKALRSGRLSEKEVEMIMEVTREKGMTLYPAKTSLFAKWRGHTLTSKVCLERYQVPAFFTRWGLETFFNIPKLSAGKPLTLIIRGNTSGSTLEAYSVEDSKWYVNGQLHLGTATLDLVIEGYNWYSIPESLAIQVGEYTCWLVGR